MLPLPAGFSQVFLDTFSLQGCLQPVRFASLLHIRPRSLTNQIPETINAVLISLEGLVLPWGIRNWEGRPPTGKTAAIGTIPVWFDKTLLPDGWNIGKFRCYVNYFYLHYSSHRRKRCLVGSWMPDQVRSGMTFYMFDCRSNNIADFCPYWSPNRVFNTISRYYWRNIEDSPQ